VDEQKEATTSEGWKLQNAQNIPDWRCLAVSRRDISDKPIATLQRRGEIESLHFIAIVDGSPISHGKNRLPTWQLSHSGSASDYLRQQ
jgi:hypothetical protein